MDPAAREAVMPAPPRAELPRKRSRASAGIDQKPRRYADQSGRRRERQAPGFSRPFEVCDPCRREQLRAAADGDDAQPGIKPRAIEVPAVPIGVAQEVALDGLVAAPD